MATNLVSLVMQYLTPDLIGRVATALGLERSSTQSAVSAVVPGLLAALSGVATQPGGAQRLVDSVGQQSGALGAFANMLGGSGQTSAIEKGSQALTSLLGGQNQSALASAVGKFAGLSPQASGSLLGLLGPVVMGTIGQQSGALSANGIAGLLAGQKANIAAALPAGFGKLLEGAGLLDSIGGAAQTATTAARQAAGAAASAAQTAASSTQRSATTAVLPARNWAYWLIPLAAVAVLAIYLVSKPTEQAIQQGAATTQSLTVGGADIGKQVGDSLTSLRSTLGAVTDTASAQASLPKLQDVTAQIDKVDALIAQLSPEQKKILAGLVGPQMPALNQLFDKVLGVPGVSDILKPVIDSLKAKLATLTA
jgi:hypothetical protein